MKAPCDWEMTYPPGKTEKIGGSTQQSMPYAIFLLHRPDDLGHVLKLLLIFCFSPLVLSFRKEFLVILCRIIVGIKQILKVIESDDVVL